jgi:hypothetical protein
MRSKGKGRSTASSASSAQHSASLLCEAVEMTLAARFAPARRLFCWNDQPLVVPGFQVRPDGVSAVVRYIQPRAGTLQAQRARTQLMLKQYRQTLVTQGWQVDCVDEPKRPAYLRCYDTGIIMSTKE